MSRPSSPPRVVFVDRLTVASLLSLIWPARHAAAIWYFDPMAPSVRILVGLLRRLRIVRAEVRQNDHPVGEIRDDTGKSQFFDVLWSHLRDTTLKIRDKQISPNPLIRRMGSYWDLDKLVLHFERRIEREIKEESYRVDLVAWVLRSRMHLDPTQALIMIERGRWFPFFVELAGSEGIPVAFYRDPLRKVPWAGRQLYNLLKEGRGYFGMTLRSGMRRLPGEGHQGKRPATTTGGTRSGAGTVAIRAFPWYRSLSLDRSARSEFFWLHESSIPYEEVLVHDYVTDRPLDDETRRELDVHGIRVLGRGPGIARWRPTRRFTGVLFRSMYCLGRNWLSCTLRGRWTPPHVLYELVLLAASYSYWHDFYTANRVRVNVGHTFSLKVSQILALDAVNGVSCAYQYTTSIMSQGRSTLSYMSAGEDVLFLFSPAFERLWRSLGAPVKDIVTVGFIDDGATQYIRARSGTSDIRRNLQANGARFVLCYFDGGSEDRWTVAASNEDATRDYEFLLNWLLSDPTLGMVFKPKSSAYLLQRIQRISDLVQRAQESGRCHFFSSDHYPTEAALAADLCVGKLGTAPAEATLAGVTSVMIDVEGYREHPFHAWGRGRVIFDDWPSLRAAVEAHRAAPEEHPEFGDWSPGLDDIDPFRDGKAGVRIGRYVGLIYESLKQGGSKEDALAEAAERYGQWVGEEVYAG